MTQYFQQIPSAQNILPKISCQSYDIVCSKARPRIGAFLYKNSNDHDQLSCHFAVTSCLGFDSTRAAVLV
jgi:hypothetical protein